MTTPWPTERWLEDPAVADIEYARYWNDAEAERDKPFYVVDGDFSKLERYLDQVGLVEDLRHCLGALERRRGRPLAGFGVDVAAGALWAAPLLLEADAVERLWCVEYSAHRLFVLGPRVLEHYAVDPDRVVLAYGSFYDLRIPDASLDFALLCQAFHHADRPEALLAELRRVLRPGGAVIVIGEHRVRIGHYARYAAWAAASLLPRRLQQRLLGHPVNVRMTLRPRAAELMPPDALFGDHTYDDDEYARMFDGEGFGWEKVRRPGAHYVGFLLERRP